MDHSYYFDTLKRHSSSENCIYLFPKVSKTHEFYSGDRFFRLDTLMEVKTNKYKIDEINMHD